MKEEKLPPMVTLDGVEIKAGQPIFLVVCKDLYCNSKHRFSGIVRAYIVSYTVLKVYEAVNQRYYYVRSLRDNSEHKLTANTEVYGEYASAELKCKNVLIRDIEKLQIKFDLLKSTIASLKGSLKTKKYVNNSLLNKKD